LPIQDVSGAAQTHIGSCYAGFGGLEWTPRTLGVHWKPKITWVQSVFGHHPSKKDGSQKEAIYL